MMMKRNAARRSTDWRLNFRLRKLCVAPAQVSPHLAPNPSPNPNPNPNPNPGRRWRRVGMLTLALTLTRVAAGVGWVP